MSKVWQNTDPAAAGTSQGKAECNERGRDVDGTMSPRVALPVTEFTDEGIRWGLGSLVDNSLTAEGFVDCHASLGRIGIW